MSMTSNEAEMILTDFAHGHRWFARAYERVAAEKILFDLRNGKATSNSLARTNERLEQQVRELQLVKNTNANAKANQEIATAKLKDMVVKFNEQVNKIKDLQSELKRVNLNNLTLNNSITQLSKKLQTQAYHSDIQQEQMENLLEEKKNNLKKFDELQQQFNEEYASHNETRNELEKIWSDNYRANQEMEAIRKNEQQLQSRLAEEVNRVQEERAKLEAEVQSIATLAVENQAKVQESEAELKRLAEQIVYAQGRYNELKESINNIMTSHV